MNSIRRPGIKVKSRSYTSISQTGYPSAAVSNKVLKGARAPALAHASHLKVRTALAIHQQQLTLHEGVKDPVPAGSITPALANAMFSVPQLSQASDFPHWGYLEYLALIDDDIQWTPITALKANDWRLKDMGYLLGLSPEQIRNYSNWWRQGIEGINYGRLRAKPMYHLCQCLGVPLSGLLWDARRRNEKKHRNVGLPLALSMIEMIRPNLIELDKWVFDNLTSQYFSSIPLDRVLASVYRHRQDHWGEPLTSSMHQNLTEVHLKALPDNLRLMVRNLRQLLRDSPADGRKNRALQSIEPLECHWEYWVLARARFNRLKGNDADLSDALQRYVSFKIDPTPSNQFDLILEKFPNFTQSVLQPKEWPELDYVDEISSTVTGHPPAQEVWLEKVETKLDKIPWKRVERWLPIHQVMIKAMDGVVREAVMSINPGQYHGGWRWLGNLRPYVDRIVEGIGKSEAHIHFDLDAFFKLLGMVPEQSWIDTDAYSTAWRKIYRKPQVLEVLQNPTQYFIPTTVGRPILYPDYMEVIQNYTFTFLQADPELFQCTVQRLIQGFTMGVNRKWLGNMNLRSRAMEATDPAWIDVLYQMSIGVDLRPPTAGLAATEELIPTVYELLVSPNFTPRSPEISSKSDLEMAGAQYMGQLWMLSPGTTYSGSTLANGVRIAVLEHRDSVIQQLYNRMPLWAGFMRNRWNHFNSWFCVTRQVGSFFASWMKDCETVSTENQLCNSVSNIENRLFPLLRLAHVPVPIFIKWMMNLRGKGMEIAGCHYYVKSERTGVRGRENTQPMKTWVPSSEPGCNRKDDQLYLLWTYYINQCKRHNVEVDKALTLSKFEAWYDESEVMFGNQASRLSEAESEAKKAKLIEDELEVQRERKEKETLRKAQLKEIEG